MDRREFLNLAATASALALTGPMGSAFSAARDAWATAFRAALRDKPYLLGWLGTQEARLKSPQLTIEGQWPTDLRGTFFRNGSARHEIGGMRYRHWFDGDGMVQAFRIADGKVSHLGRIVETDKVKAESKAGRALRRTFGTNFPGMETVRRPDFVNTANISVVWHANRLLALWEGGSAHRLNPENLDTYGLLHWSKRTQGLPFGAHPRVDTDGTLWNIGYGSAFGVLVLYRVGADGALKEARPVKVKDMPMVHDFVITEHHLLVILPPLVFERGEGKTILDSYTFHADRPARVLIVDKSNLSNQRWLEMPAHFTFHYGNAWEDTHGVIRLDEARYENSSVMFGPLRDVMRGRGGSVKSRPAQQHLVTIDPMRGRIDETPLISRDYAVEFPHVDRRRAGRRYRKVTTLLSDPTARARHPMPNTVARLDIETGGLSTYTYAATTIPEEHLFVPKPGSDSEDDGWIVGTSLDFAAGVSRVSVFDAQHLHEGPLAVASLPYAIPLGFHGTFVSA